jgi:hypothetical protein
VYSARRRRPPTLLRSWYEAVNAVTPDPQISINERAPVVGARRAIHFWHLERRAAR